ncbi:MAG: AMP-dependent synthetase/ligase, partial [Bifidobacteriaceae bacterium]|nr:AMP-dependent synthetase/ligase [Bifidobacteriaceae bacterium]
MKTFTYPAAVPFDANLTVPRLLRRRRDFDPAATVVESQDDAGTWHPIDGTEFVKLIEALGRGLIAAGVKAGDCVGLLGRTSWQWAHIDLACMSIGAVTVPIYETASAEQIQWIAQDSRFEVVFVEGPQHRAHVEGALSDYDGLREIWTYSEGAIDQLMERGSSTPDEELSARQDALTGGDVATIIYTSGTTGRPKGVQLTHTNLCNPAVNTAIALAFLCGPGSRLLQFLPLAHSFARQINMIALASQAVIGYIPSTANLVADLNSYKPTFTLVVPRVVEKIYNSAEQAAGGGFRLKLFRLAAKVAIVYSRELDTVRGPRLRRRIQRAVFHRLVYRRILATLGGHVKYFVSGGAPLGERLGHFFRGIGVTIYEGYGLTETTAPTSVNLQQSNKIGTVGPPLPAMSVAVADDGEVLAKGPHIFIGYLNNPEATAEAFTEDGWFRTGDVGSLDDDGHITITGRRKELIVTAGGKNVAPAILEDRLRGHPLVSQCVVVGDKRPFVGALITLDLDMLPGWLKMHGKSELTHAQALIDPDIRASLSRAVERANRAVSRAESIRKFRLLDTDFTEANGYLTPSMKVKRTLVLQDFAQEVEALYNGPGRARGGGGGG